MVYSYDSYARLIKVQRYPQGPSGAEDLCQQEDYYYDGTNPVSSSYPTDALGHLSAVQYWGGNNPNAGNPCDTTFTELYNYGQPGAPVGKQLQISRAGVSQTITLTAAFTYDTEGRMTGETYPSDYVGNTANLGYTFDSMGRLNTMTDKIANAAIIQGATYGPANELLTITGGNYINAWAGETRSYNSLKQLTGILAYNSPGPVSISYNYPATGNNGKIVSQTDDVSGETVTYAYDALNRLAAAATQADISASWGQSFSYDGFGNLTNVNVTLGTAPTLLASYDPGTNHPNAAGLNVDANGNPGYIPVPADGGTNFVALYDVENRLVSVAGTLYSYAPGNKRVWRGNATRSLDVVTFWSVSGQKLAEYSLNSSSFYATQTGTNYYFGSMLIKNGNSPTNWVYSDRLGSVGKFFPYGVERPSATTNGTEKFTGYFRDNETGNDYADQRYSSPGYGRFLTPDSMGGRAADPSSWNKYAYTRGDPINRIDPGGNYDCTVGVGEGAETTACENYTVYEGPANPQCMLLAQAGAAGNPAATELYETYCTSGGGVTASTEGSSAPTAINNFQPLNSNIFNVLSAALAGTVCGAWFQAGLATSGNAQYGGQSLSDFLTNYLPQFVGSGDFVGGNSNSLEGGAPIPVNYLIAMNNEGAFSIQYHRAKRSVRVTTIQASLQTLMAEALRRKRS